MRGAFAMPAVFAMQAAAARQALMPVRSPDTGKRLRFIRGQMAFMGSSAHKKTRISAGFFFWKARLAARSPMCYELSL